MGLPLAVALCSGRERPARHVRLRLSAGVGIDVDPSKVDAINQGRSYISDIASYGTVDDQRQELEA